MKARFKTKSVCGHKTVQSSFCRETEKLAHFRYLFWGNNIPRKNSKSEVFKKKQSWQSLFLHRLMAAVPRAPVCPFPCLDKDRGRPGSLLANSDSPLLFLPLEVRHSQSHLYSSADLAKTSENTNLSKVWPPFSGLTEAGPNYCWGCIISAILALSPQEYAEDLSSENLVFSTD